MSQDGRGQVRTSVGKQARLRDALAARSGEGLPFPAPGWVREADQRACHFGLCRVLLLLLPVLMPACGSPTDDPVELPDDVTYSPEPDPVCEVFTCRYTVFGSPACIDYYAVDGWNASLASDNCIHQFSAKNVNTDPQPTCLSAGVTGDSVLSDGACADTDDQNRTYYAFGVTESECSTFLTGSWSSPPLDVCASQTTASGQHAR